MSSFSPPFSSAAQSAMSSPLTFDGVAAIVSALRDAIDLGTASVDVDSRATATTSPFTLDEVAAGSLVQDTLTIGGTSIKRTACDDAIANLFASPEILGTADTEATPTGWVWGGSYTNNGRRWIRSGAFTGKQAVELIAGSQQAYIEQAVAGLTIGQTYCVQLYIEEMEVTRPQRVIAVDGTQIDAEGTTYSGLVGWHWATFVATATSHTIRFGVGIDALSYGRLVFSMPIMTLGAVPVLWSSGSRSAQTVTLNIDALLGEVLSSDYRLLTATWDYDSSGASVVSVAFSNGADQTALTLATGKASLLLTKKGGWTAAEETALQNAITGGSSRLAGYLPPSADIPAVVEFGDSTTVGGVDQDASQPPLAAAQVGFPTATVRIEGVGGNRTYQIRDRLMQAAKEAYKQWVLVINAGANDVSDSTPAATVMSQIAEMVSYIAPNTRYLVKTPVRNVLWSAAQNAIHAELVASINSVYGDRVIQVYETLGDNYKSDDIHPNSAGYQIIADLTAAKLRSFNWLSDVYTPVSSTPDAAAWAANANTSWTTSGITGQRKEADDALAEFEANLRSLGIWEDLTCVLPFAGSDLTSALVPQKGVAPTAFNFVEGDYQELVGLTGNAAGSKYLDTGYKVPGAAEHLMALHGKAFAVSGAEAVYCGNDERDAGRRQYLLEHYNNARRFASHSGTLATQGSTETAGVMVLTAYQNGNGESFSDGAAPRSQAQTEYVSAKNIGINARIRNSAVNAFSSHTNFTYLFSNSAGLPGHKQYLFYFALNLLARRLGRLTQMVL